MILINPPIIKKPIAIRPPNKSSRCESVKSNSLAIADKFGANKFWSSLLKIKIYISYDGYLNNKYKMNFLPAKRNTTVMQITQTVYSRL